MISSRFNHEIELVPGKILPIVEEMTDFYIEQVAAKINMPINKKQLKIELLSHMKPMVNRMNHQIHIKNNLLSDIKLEYGELFEIIKETARDVAKTFKLNTISDDEVGYITIYFAETHGSVSSSQTNYHYVFKRHRDVRTFKSKGSKSFSRC